MTVTTTLDRQYFPADGANKNFPFNFKFFNNSQIYVSLISPDGTVTPKSITTDYTLSGATAIGGGTVVMNDAPPLTVPPTRVFIQRIIPQTQPTSIRNQGRFFPEIHEDAFDRLTMLSQQAEATANNALQKSQSGLYWDFLNLPGKNAADPTDQQDVATKNSVELYVGSILQTGQGPANIAANVLYVAPNGVTGTVQDMSGPGGSKLIGHNAETVGDALSRAGVANEYAWGNVKQNETDFASFGPNLAPAFSAFTKTNFSATGVHGAGTVGTLTAPAVIPAFSFYKLVLTVLTTAPGGLQVNLGEQKVFSDTPDGYYFSNEPFLTDGIEQDRVLSTTVYTFMAETSGAAQSSISIVTDLKWAGQITGIDFRKVDPTKFSVAGAGTGNGTHNPIGMKAVGYNRNDVVLGDKYTLGMLYDDGLPLMGAHNVAIGSRALASNAFGNENTAVGTYAMQYNEGTNNVAVGYSSFKLNTKGQENTGIGFKSGVLNTTGFRNTYTGFWCFGQQTTGDENTGAGWFAGRNLKLGARNTFMGARTGQLLNKGNDNTFVGALAGYAEGEGVVDNNNLVGVGSQAIPFGDGAISIGYAARTGTQAAPSAGSIAIGQAAIARGTAPSISIGKESQATGARSVGVGESSRGLGQQSVAVGAIAQANGDYSVSVGSQAGRNNTGTRNTFVGPSAGAGTNTYTNASAIGSFAVVTGNNQVQLGDSATTTYVYGTVQNRSDKRDKCDIEPTYLGLDFIRELRPVQGRWDMRDDYVTYHEDGTVELTPRDGSKRRTRLHQWFIAQEVVDVCEKLGVEFGGVQNQSVNGGEDIYTLGYDEFIPPIVRALQQVDATVEALLTRITALEARLNNSPE